MVIPPAVDIHRPIILRTHKPSKKSQLESILKFKAEIMLF